MVHRTFLAALLALAVALAGCAGDTTDSSGTNATTTTPATGATTTTTPPTSPTNDSTNGTDDLPPPLDCPDPVSTNETPGDVLGYPEIVFTVTEPAGEDPCFSFVGPATATAGWTAVTLNNTGMQPHIMPMYFIGERTLDDVMAAMGAGEEPEWLVGAGGVGVATPFSSGTAILNLTEGNYLVICFFGGHHTQGMYRILTVEAADENATLAEEPEAAVTIEMLDFEYNAPNVTAGRQIVRIVNNGTQPHEAPMVRLLGNATMDEFVHQIESPGAAPPPGAGVGGVNVLAPGAVAYAVVDFQAGANYGLVCFVEDPASHKPHLALGMIAQFSVENETA